jgi:flagellar biosynthetic protein FliO
MNGSEVTVVPTGYGLYLLQTVLALGAVCLLAYVVLRYGAKRLYGAGPRPGKVLTLVERLPLDPRRSIYLVDVAGRQVLLGTSDQGGVTFLTEVEKKEPVDPSPDPLPPGEGQGEE